jgi:archaellin
MKKILFLSIIMSINIFVYADDILTDINNIKIIINENIGENYINWNRSSVSYSDNNGNIYALFISIYFNTNTYEMEFYFYDIIVNKLMIELKNNYNLWLIHISPYFPFSIILNNNNEYDLEEKNNIIREIKSYQFNSRFGIENIFQNTSNGYITGFHFIEFTNLNTIHDFESINRDRLYNVFLELINSYFGEVNKIEF